MCFPVCFIENEGSDLMEQIDYRTIADEKTDEFLRECEDDFSELQDYKFVLKFLAKAMFIKGYEYANKELSDVAQAKPVVEQ